MIKKMKPLNAKEQRFVDEYLINPNPEKAAIIAGYKPSVARSKAYCWVSNSQQNNKPHVFSAIKNAQNERARQLGITQGMVLQELYWIAFSNISHYVHWSADGVRLIDSDQIPADHLSAIASISHNMTEHGINLKFKLQDKIRALMLVGKHLGMFTGEPPKTIHDVIMQMDEQTAKYIQELWEKDFETVQHDGDDSSGGA